MDKKRLEKADAKLKLKQDKRALQEKSVSETKGSDTCCVHMHILVSRHAPYIYTLGVSELVK